ncbi:hypothetical protein [uncultured Clostridium sp.]|uniref:hypothetical protein n=1 Tax=uncultured Clostridium sp. TaxID=59620 RepID=UPI002597CA0E|nr:hypothetical protein [uncultured Clostridium sp.]
MKKIIDKYNEKNFFPFILPYPKTDLQILKTYKFLSMIQDKEIQEMLKDVKLPKIDSWKDYFTLNKDGNEYYTIDLTIAHSNWNIDEIEEAIRKGKIILAENDEGIIETVTSISINLKDRTIRVNIMDNIYTNDDTPV